MSALNPAIREITDRITARSQASRKEYLRQVRRAGSAGPARFSLSCSNLAHGMAACGPAAKKSLASRNTPNIGIVSAYNDMLSAHQPFERYPSLIKEAASHCGATAQLAGGVPAMCDGITQGQDGMDLSLFSRDVIALSTVVALSHNMFDAALCLGICDKIVPGLLIGALAFGHLPVVFVPAGPMVSGLSNTKKSQAREAFAAGRIGREQLLQAESAAYHGAGTCTFYGTANSNQMLMEFMGLQLPGGSFVNPGTELRRALTIEAVHTVLAGSETARLCPPIGEIVSEKSIVNGIVGLLATGGSTNHTMHLVTIAAAAGVHIDWRDFADLSEVVPVVARVYPNGSADVNHFHAAGGLGYCMRQLLDAGLLHDDVETICGPGLRNFCQEPFMAQGKLAWRPAPVQSLDTGILRPAEAPFQATGGLKVLNGNLGAAIVKVSAVDPQDRAICAKARVFPSQAALKEAFDSGGLDGDFVAVLPNQGPRANGMPELHKLTPYLSLARRNGSQAALLTDGRMSGASGSVLAAIHVTPESSAGGPIGRIRDGDRITIDANQGVLSTDADLQSRGGDRNARGRGDADVGMGRELFALFRQAVSGAEHGATIFSPR